MGVAKLDVYPSCPTYGRRVPIDQGSDGFIRVCICVLQAASQRMSHTAETMGKKLKERFMQITSQTTTQMFMDTFLRLDEVRRISYASFL